MSVYTSVSLEALTEWLGHYRLSGSVLLEPILEGITNSNYFVLLPDRKLVLTLFEAIDLNEAPVYLELMHHLASHGVPCPLPLADYQGGFVSMLAGKPACLVTYLAGHSVDHSNVAQCEVVGKMLANMHLAGQTFPRRVINPRGLAWWNQTAHHLYPLLSTNDAKLLREEIDFQNAHQDLAIPKSIIHADLFKDNVLMDQDQVIGFIDFYYACYDYLLYDIAITLNSWAGLPEGDIDDKKAQALLKGYQSIRLLNKSEIVVWPAMLRAAALRFWLSRLQDAFYPMPGEMTYIKDPMVFRLMLRKYRLRSEYWL